MSEQTIQDGLYTMPVKLDKYEQIEEMKLNLSSKITELAGIVVSGDC